MQTEPAEYELAELSAVKRHLELREAYVKELEGVISRLENEVSILQVEKAKLDRLRNRIGSLPGGRWLIARLGRRATR